MNLTNPENVERVAIIGAGTIGASWAAHFLARGMHVWVWDPGPGSMRNFLEHFGPNIENWWRDMRDVTLTAEVKAALIDGVEAEAAGRNVEALAGERDARLLDLLEMLKRHR